MAVSRPRTVDGPPRLNLGERAAARWLGWGIKRFRAAAREQATWFRASGPGERKLYHWMDLVALQWIYLRRQEATPESAPEKPARKS